MMKVRDTRLLVWRKDWDIILVIALNNPFYTWWSFFSLRQGVKPRWLSRSDCVQVKLCFILQVSPLQWQSGQLWSTTRMAAIYSDVNTMLWRICIIHICFKTNTSICIAILLSFVFRKCFSIKRRKIEMITILPMYMPFKKELSIMPAVAIVWHTVYYFSIWETRTTNHR